MEFLSKGMDLVLWWTYQRGEWWKGVFLKRITFFGWLVVFITGVSGVFGTDVVNNALGFIFFLGALLILIDFLSLFFRRTRAVVDFKGISTGVTSVGQRVNLPFTVEAPKPLKRINFILYPWVEEVSYSEFRAAREPREKERNIVDRCLKFYRWKWLRNSRLKPFSPTYDEQASRSAGNTRQQELSLPVQFQARGKWSLENVRAHLPGVFGLFERSCKTGGERGEVFVAPQIFPVRFFAHGGAGMQDALSLETSPRAGESQEFLSLREYRPGDSWRKMNWKAMARTDKAMIQETEEPGVPSFLIVWETEESGAAEFEAGASILASLVTHFHAVGARGGIQIIHGESRAFYWTEGTSEILRALAEIQRGEAWNSEEGEAVTASVTFSLRAAALEKSQAEADAIPLLISGAELNGVEIKKEVVIS